MNTKKSKKVEEILNSLDRSSRATIPDFFYTRLKARMERGLSPATKKSWVLRPAFAFVTLIIVLLMNAAVILKGDAAKKSAVTDNETIQSIAAEYSLNDNNTILFDSNQDK